MNDIRGKRVFVGLSGGVDSAVSAALLKEAGAKLTGVFIKGWYPPGMPCTWASERRDAMRVAARLGLPFLTLDAAAEYKSGVIDYLLAEYAAGRTPNPDVMCNREVKFGAFWRFAKEQGADFIATGHYAQLVAEHGEVLLCRGSDASKDQSYFLWAVPKEALAGTLFPVGNLPKRDVRKLARRFRLPNAGKRDSQGICFLGSISVDDFLRAELGTEPGMAVDEEGKPVGRHDGAVLHTLGERIALKEAMPGPWYVVRKDLARNRLVVTREPRAQKESRGVALHEASWLRTPAPGETLEAQYRYHGPLIRGAMNAGLDAFIPASPLPEAIAPGQSLVLYEGAVLIGGGIVVEDAIIS